MGCELIYKICSMTDWFRHEGNILSSSYSSWVDLVWFEKINHVHSTYEISEQGWHRCNGTVIICTVPLCEPVPNVQVTVTPLWNSQSGIFPSLELWYGSFSSIRRFPVYFSTIYASNASTEPHLDIYIWCYTQFVSRRASVQVAASVYFSSVSHEVPDAGGCGVFTHMTLVIHILQTASRLQYLQICQHFNLHSGTLLWNRYSLVFHISGRCIKRSLWIRSKNLLGRRNIIPIVSTGYIGDAPRWYATHWLCTRLIYLAPFIFSIVLGPLSSDRVSQWPHMAPHIAVSEVVTSATDCATIATTVISVCIRPFRDRSMSISSSLDISYSRRCRPLPRRRKRVSSAIIHNTLWNAIYVAKQAIFIFFNVSFLQLFSPHFKF